MCLTFTLSDPLYLTLPLSEPLCLTLTLSDPLCLTLTLCLCLGRCQGEQDQDWPADNYEETAIQFTER